MPSNKRRCSLCKLLLYVLAAGDRVIYVCETCDGIRP